MADTTVERNPPYISQNIWKPFFEKMQKVKRPPELSAAILKEYGLAAGAPALQSALKFLGLTDAEDKTTERFKTIQVTGEQFKKNLGGIINDAYADLLDKHPLESATYEGITNYFADKYSPASAKKIAKSFAVLCQMAGIDSPAFTKMRSLDDRPVRQNAGKREDVPSAPKRSGGSSPVKEHRTDIGGDDLVKEFIKTNPMPTGMQWDAATMKEYFEQYRETLKMLKGETKEA
ncbi:MAG: hypothetical protein D4R81_05940 [Nitrospiraceae bacterium]|nr:MAG: hypothetical protein D4R81_05940 [Nitrospiraceae bacterium]